MWWRTVGSMAVSTQLLFLVLRGLGVCAMEHSQASVAGHNSEAILTPGGKFTGVGGARRLHMMRRQGEEDPAAPELTEIKNKKQFYTVDEETRRAKIELGLAASFEQNTEKDPWAISSGQHSNTDVANQNWHAAPAWEAHPTMPSMPTCVQDVTTEMGISDYGSIQHSCTSCGRNCTQENKQNALNLTWLFEPPLATCNAFDVSLYANWSDISQLGCSSCFGKGLRHQFEFAMSTNAGEGHVGYEDRVLHFPGWMGPEVSGGPGGGGSDFGGLHVFEMEDTEEPSESSDCDAANPVGRWLAIPGGLKQDETFMCERVCKSSHACNCGRHTTTRCTAAIAMSSGQLFAYRIRISENSATGTLDGNSYVGAEWEVTAEDLTESSPVMVVGRIILAGNSAVYGIKELRQSHQHLGCVECDLFYESTIVSGPFITDPADVHVVRSSDGVPPPLTSESCELFRISSISGYAVKFESGPGLWPPFEVNDTIFSCSHTAANTCPS